jgi:predicted esterase
MSSAGEMESHTTLLATTDHATGETAETLSTTGGGESANPEAGSSESGRSATTESLPDSSDGGASSASASESDTGEMNPGDGMVGPLPRVPEPAEPCPTFTTGRQTIMGLETEILAGEPGATPGPLLFNWHGTGSSGRAAIYFQLPSSVRDDIESQGGLIIAPNDDGRTREGDSANGVWYETSDLAYADPVVACAVREHNIDPRRIYVTGCSAGGLMASSMAIQRSSYVAAVAPSSGGIVSTFGVELEDPARVPASMTMHGGAGDVVVIGFERTSQAFDDFIIEAGGFAVDCNHGDGHCGTPGPFYEAAWEFLKAHPFGTNPSPYVGGLPSSFPSECTIWP